MLQNVRGSGIGVKSPLKKGWQRPFTSARKMRCDQRLYVLARADRHNLEGDAGIAPIQHPVLDQCDVVAFHDLKAAAKFRRNPAAVIGQSFGQDAASVFDLLVGRDHIVVREGFDDHNSMLYLQMLLPLPGNPRSAHISSTFATTSSAMRSFSPHSRFVSGGHLLVASRPIFEPRPLSGLAKSR